MAGILDTSRESMTKTALMLVDMQNDFIHPDGAYGRGGAKSLAIAALLDRVAPVARAVRKAGGFVGSTLFTLVQGPDGKPLISAHLKRLRPFLGAGDFVPGSWGQALVDELQSADFAVEKIAYSAFYQSRLEWVLKRLNIETLIFAGIVTNGGVAATLRDAHVREFSTILLSDGCGAFSREIHDATVTSLGSVATVMTCSEIIDKLDA